MLRRALHHLGLVPAPGTARPAYALGLRAAIATVAPLLLAQLAGIPDAGTWTSIAALNGVLADPGGTYRRRARVQLVLAATSAVAAALGTLVAGHPALAVALTFAVAVVGGLARIWGSAGAGVGLPSVLAYVIALAIPLQGEIVPAAAARAEYMLAGGAWAMLLTLVLWPIWPERPARRAVDGCWRALAAYAAEVARRVGAGEAPDAWALRERTAAVRGELEAARGVLAATRRSRPGGTGSGERLLLLYAYADHAFIHLVALAETIASLPTELRRAGESVLARALAEAATSFEAIAAAVTNEGPDVPPPRTWSGAAVRERLAPAGARAGELELAHAAALLDRLAEYTGDAIETVAALDEAPPPAPLPTGAAGDAAPAEERVALADLRGALAADSVILRFAVRAGIVAAGAVGLAGLAGLSHTHWITITALVVLQPYTGITTQRATQRVLGTTLGGMLTAALGALFQGPGTILFLCFLFTGLSVALIRVSYAAFSVFVTPAFVLLAEVGTGDWDLAGVRVVNTFLGGALAWLAARLIWPQPEWNRLPTHFAALLRAQRDYLDAVVALVGRGGGSVEPLGEVRRRIALAQTNADESFQRLLGEHRGDPAALEPSMAVLAEGRRLNAAIGALGAAGATMATTPSERRRLERFGQAAGATLAELAEAVGARRMPAPLARELAAAPASDASAPHALLDARARHVEQRVRGSYEAVVEWLRTRPAIEERRREPRGDGRRAPAEIGGR